MRPSQALLSCLVVLGIAEVLGVTALSRVPVGELTSDIGPAAGWLAWFFGLWGMLTLAVIYVVTWVAEGHFITPEITVVEAPVAKRPRARTRKATTTPKAA
jgi:hypothetical protein